MKLTIILILSLFTFMALAAPNCATLNSRWKDLYFKRFKVAWQMKKFACPSPMSRVAETFYYLETIKFKGTNPPNYWNFVVQGLRNVKYKPKHDSYEWAWASESGGNIILHDAWMRSDDNITRLEIFVHEAQHMRKDDPGHVKCLRGASKGKNACDSKFFEKTAQGSGYNHGFKYLWWLRDASENHELDKKAAGLKMQWMVNNRFNSITNEEIQKFTIK